MHSVAPTGLVVGALSGRPMLQADERRLMKLDVPADSDAESRVREALNSFTDIDFIDDPQGAHLEAVPYEHLTIAGPSWLVDELRLSLPRYFGPICYRALGFHMRHTTLGTGRAVLLFGSHLDTRARARTGSLRWVPKDAKEPKDGGAPWLAGQARGLFTLDDGSALPGLDPLPLPFPLPGYVISLEPGHGGPCARLHKVAPGLVDRVAAVLDAGVAGQLVNSAPPGCHDIAFPAQPAAPWLDQGVLRIVPDSSQSRPMAVRPESEEQILNFDRLEIVGVFLPMPGRQYEVQALSIALLPDALCADPLVRPEAELALVGRSERVLRMRDGSVIQVSRFGGLPGLDLNLSVAPGEAQRFSPLSAGELLLGSTSSRAIGLIRLPEPPQRTTSSEVRAAEVAHRLSYRRNRWISQYDPTLDGVGLHLDWLDTTVRVITRGTNGGAAATGLATLLAERLRQADVEILVRAEGTLAHRYNGQKTVLRDGTIFRFGPLRLRFRKGTSG